MSCASSPRRRDLLLDSSMLLSPYATSIPPQTVIHPKKTVQINIHGASNVGGKKRAKGRISKKDTAIRILPRVIELTPWIRLSIQSSAGGSALPGFLARGLVKADTTVSSSKPHERQNLTSPAFAVAHCGQYIADLDYLDRSKQRCNHYCNVVLAGRPLFSPYLIDHEV